MGKGEGNGSSTERIAAWQWQPGQSGNPKGRPRKRPITSEYENILATPAPDVVVDALRRFGAKRGDSWARVIGLAQVRNALMPSGVGALAARELREACEGKAPRRLEVLTSEERAISITVEYEPPRYERPVLDQSVPGMRERIIDATPEPSDTESPRKTNE
jgi:hypothetical protein